MSTIVLTSKASASSAKDLADALGADYENPYETENRDFTKYDLVVKYGFSKPVKTKQNCKVFNKSQPTVIALDKITTFKLFEGDNITVDFTQDIKTAAKWIKEGSAAVARATATGHNSEGVTFCNTTEELLENVALFWTKYTKHTNEFRANVWRNKVVSVYNKNTVDDTFYFQLFQGVNEHPQLVELVNKVYNKLKLDWYGLDLLRDEGGNLLLLEINSAPILYPYTLHKLTTIIQQEEATLNAN